MVLAEGRGSGWLPGYAAGVAALALYDLPVRLGGPGRAKIRPGRYDPCPARPAHRFDVRAPLRFIHRIPLYVVVPES